MGRKKQSTESKIIKAAWKLFYAKGYEDTTVDEIIAASKTSKGTFYHYFKGKDALLSTLSDLFDQKYEELYAVIDPKLSAYDKLMFLTEEVFFMIEKSVDVTLLASLYSSQLLTKDEKHLLNQKRFYYTWIREIMHEGLDSNEFHPSSTVDELVKFFTLFERALLYDWAICEGNYELTSYSQKMLKALLDSFIRGFEE